MDSELWSPWISLPLKGNTRSCKLKWLAINKLIPLLIPHILVTGRNPLACLLLMNFCDCNKVSRECHWIIALSDLWNPTTTLNNCHHVSIVKENPTFWVSYDISAGLRLIHILLPNFWVHQNHHVNTILCNTTTIIPRDRNLPMWFYIALLPSLLSQPYHVARYHDPAATNPTKLNFPPLSTNLNLHQLHKRILFWSFSGGGGWGPAVKPTYLAAPCGRLR